MQDWSLSLISDANNHKADPAMLEEVQKATGAPVRHLKHFSPGRVGLERASSTPMDDARSRLYWASCCRTTHLKMSPTLCSEFSGPLISPRRRISRDTRRLLAMLSTFDRKSSPRKHGTQTSNRGGFPGGGNTRMPMKGLEAPCKHIEMQLHKARKERRRRETHHHPHWHRLSCFLFNPNTAVPDVSENDLVIFMVGPKGAGKSWVRSADIAL